ncbi:MAG: (2Fe-2S)-binding protein [Bacillota bacterium]
MSRVEKHIILGDPPVRNKVTITVDNIPFEVYEGEMIAAALWAHGKKDLRYTKKGNPRGVYCGIGRCTDCVMVVDGVPNVRTCKTPVKGGMVIETQQGVGSWKGGGIDNE